MSLALAQITNSLETVAGASTSANTTAPGYWKRIAAALETIAGASTTANDNLPGYLLRAAVAAEVIGGTSGAEENLNETGGLKRIVDALEANVGAVASGSLTERFRIAASLLSGDVTPPSLTALALDDTSIPEDSAATINIAGATSGSTISLLSGALPAGMALSSALRTISGTPTTPETASFTLRETLAGATNTPRDTALSIEVTEVVTGLDPTLVAPTLSLAVAQNVFPPQLSAAFDVSTLSTDDVRLEVATDEAFTTVVLDETLPVGTGDQDFSLETLTTEVQRWFRERIQRGSSYGPWSDVVSHGDVVAPTITSSASPSVAENTVNPTGTLTASEAVTWSKTGNGADAALFSVDADTGAWVLNATPDYEVKASYVVEWQATDLAGNATTQTMTLGITDVAEVTPLVFNSTTGVNKHQNITVSGGGLAAAGISTPNSAMGVRSATPIAVDAFSFEFTITGLVLRLVIGVVNSSLALGPNLFPNVGTSSNGGAALNVVPGSTTTTHRINNVGTNPLLPANPLVGGKLRCAGNKTTNQISFYYTPPGGSEVQVGTTQAITTGIPDNYYAYFAAFGNGDAVTADFAGAE